MATVTVELIPAPSTPLALRFGVTYAPRVPTPPFVGYATYEAAPDVFEVFAYDDKGSGAVVFQGPLAEAFCRFARHLRMDV